VVYLYFCLFVCSSSFFIDQDALTSGNWTYYDANAHSGIPGNLKNCLEKDLGVVYEAMVSFPSGISFSSEN
jgi:hypothetical protein